MNGNPKIVAYLNTPLLASEYAARQQYEHHRAIALNSGLTDYADYLALRIAAEVEHMHELREHILLLSGIPLTEPSAIDAQDSIESDLHADDTSEQTAIDDYTQGIALCVSAGDEATANLLRHILAEELSHKNDIETLLAQIELAGFSNWAAAQIG